RRPRLQPHPDRAALPPDHRRRREAHRLRGWAAPQGVPPAPRRRSDTVPWLKELHVPCRVTQFTWPAPHRCEHLWMTYTVPYMAYGMLSPMEKTTVYLDPEISRGLKAMSRSSGRPQAQLIREALGAYLAATPRHE